MLRTLVGLKRMKRFLLENMDFLPLDKRVELDELICETKEELDIGFSPMEYGEALKSEIFRSGLPVDADFENPSGFVEVEKSSSLGVCMLSLLLSNWWFAIPSSEEEREMLSTTKEKSVLISDGVFFAAWRVDGDWELLVGELSKMGEVEIAFLNEDALSKVPQWRRKV